MSLRRSLTIHKHYGFRSRFLSMLFMGIKHLNYLVPGFFINRRSVILRGNSFAGIHHKTQLKLDHSQIIIENGTLKAGIDYGYYDGGMFDPARDVCRIHLINSTLRIRGDVSLYPGVCIFAQNAEIIIGNGTKINGTTQIIAQEKIEIGEHCNVAQGVIIRDNDGHRISTDGSLPALTCLPVIIGNHCWLGQRSMVLKGVTIHDNVVVAAGAVVTKDIDRDTLVAGVPAKPLPGRVTWED